MMIMDCSFLFRALTLSDDVARGDVITNMHEKLEKE